MALIFTTKTFDIEIKIQQILFEIVQLFKLGRVLTAVRKFTTKNFLVEFNFICLIVAFGWQNDQDEYERHNYGRVRACPDLWWASNRPVAWNLQ